MFRAMSSVYQYWKQFLSKKLTTDSTASLPLHNGLIYNLILPECGKNQFFINFCSLVDAGSPELDSRTATAALKRKPEFAKKLAIENSYTISYLINSCGLSKEKAIFASEKVHFGSPKKPNSVLTLLKKHGFSKTHIANLVRKRPVLLLYNPEKTRLPNP
ncbi:Hypothetical predicted protein [Olea europaea subsp. europaea]|uniref:Uncharacterized protein n=1 Tax=Olea europaea subsp. europaea TaxID=158383 RepID=A0A8S0V664_OLEEU|nr:Hypothetical predicted protein [Olea europaea subsp. europaea]